MAKESRRVATTPWTSAELLHVLRMRFDIRPGVLVVGADGRHIWKKPGSVVRKHKSKYGTPTPKGAVVGSVDVRGYRSFRLRFSGHAVYLQAHQVAWMLHHGKMFPAGKVCDHKDGNRQNNDPRNLRAVSGQINAHNKSKARSDSTSGLMGISWHPQSRRWRVRFQVKNAANRVSKCFVDPVKAVQHYWDLKFAYEPDMVSTWKTLRRSQLALAKTLKTGYYADLQNSVKRQKGKSA